MLLPDKHITLAESLLGLGSWILSRLDSPQSLENLWGDWKKVRGTPDFPAYHSLENLVLALDFLFAVGAINLAEGGEIIKC